MDNNKHVTDGLLVRFLLEEVTEAEQQEVNDWINADPANAAYFNHFRLIWEHSKLLTLHSAIDTNAAWERFRERTKPQPKRVALPVKWLSAAAILLLLAGGSWLFYQFVYEPSRMLVIQTQDNVLSSTLPDGSVVTLNKYSSLSCPKHFNNKLRTVQLKGEGFFNIKPDKNKPFIIEANDVSVKVVGTSFNVKSNVEKTEIIVETGIVEVRKKQNALEVHPHEKATVYKSSIKPVKEKNDDAFYNYYRTNEFTCNNTPLWRLADVLNEAYNVHITFADVHLKELQITTTFRNEPLENILAVICETFGISVEQNGKNIILK